AEYQGWICAPELADDFPSQAVQSLRQEFGNPMIRFRYLPASAALGWVDHLEARGACLLQRHERTLMRFGDGSRIEESLHKRGNKNRLRRLAKFGPVALEEITDSSRLREMFDQAVRWHDARHLAMRGSMPFVNDSRKKPFHLALAELRDLL